MELSLKIENFKLNYSTHPEVPQYGSNVFLLGQNRVYLKSGVPPESETSAYLIPPPSGATLGTFRGERVPVFDRYPSLLGDCAAVTLGPPPPSSASGPVNALHMLSREPSPRMTAAAPDSQIGKLAGVLTLREPWTGKCSNIRSQKLQYL